MQSHPRRVGAARAFHAKLDRKKRLSELATTGVRKVLVEILAVPFAPGSRDEFAVGAKLARDTAIAAVERLLKTRGHR